MKFSAHDSSPNKPTSGESAFDVLGLTHTDRAVYELSLRHPPWTAEEFAAELGYAVEAVRASQARLVSRGLLAEDPARPDHALPVPPDAAVDRLVAHVDAAAARQRAQLLGVRGELAALVSTHLAEQADSLPSGIERIREPPLATLRLAELLRATKEEIIRLQTGPPQFSGADETLTLQGLRNLRQDVRVRVVYHHEHLAETDVLACMHRVTDRGIEVRTVSELEVSATVIDRSVGVITVGCDETLMVRETNVVGTIVAMFEYCWRLAQPLPRRSAGSTTGADGLVEREQQILHLLSLGVKDDVIARQMGISVRTVRRELSAILDRLGASSRFQAGLLAVRRGWL